MRVAMLHDLITLDIRFMVSHRANFNTGEYVGFDSEYPGWKLQAI